MKTFGSFSAFPTLFKMENKFLSCWSALPACHQSQVTHRPLQENPKCLLTLFNHIPAHIVHLSDHAGKKETHLLVFSHQSRPKSHELLAKSNVKASAIVCAVVSAVAEA